MDPGSSQTFGGQPSEKDREGSSIMPRQKVVRHARGSTRILKEWFEAHPDHPYPTDQEKEILKGRTGLTIRQISYWFINARRRRGNDRPARSMAMPPNSTAVGISQPGPEMFQDGNWVNMTPLDRWRHSPPDQEAAPLTAITQAVDNSIYAQSEPNLNYHGFATDSMFSQRDLPPSSVGSFEISDSSRETHSSAFSCSSGSIASISSYGRHRRRRRNLKRRSPLNTSPNDAAKRVYQCTFCTDSFKSKFDWTRHEGTLHLVLEIWTCLPLGPKYCDPTAAQAQCALCDAVDPSDSHLQSHGWKECTAKPLSARVFYRKDHLRQHLRATHGVNDILPSMDNWKFKITRVKSRCGFCGETFSLWSDRNDHLADHFRSGSLMKDWKGCRGLEPAVALLVENAIPPYLIGIESSDLEPFSASRKASSSSPDNQAPPTLFENSTARLGDYIRVAAESGVVLTDDLLRAEARIILFGDDDAWNQTPADNPEWLDLFKKGYGLLTAPYTTIEAGEKNFPGLSSPGFEVYSPSRMNMAPFTVEKMQQASFFEPGFTSLDLCGSLPYTQSLDQPMGSDLTIPWSWQTPECLAEFSEMG